ncbi:MAG: HAMP domain-containing histidine kinase, partial [Arcobacteraceae bacterium]|nr:HAMP domain-containing histidine kinase [Arcobacteraceae bacterium]
HQWRQPLSVISTSISGLKAKRDFGIEQKDDFDKTHDTIMKSVNYLSETINTFRDFIKEKQELKTVVLQDRIDGALNIVAPALQSAYITIKKEINYTDKVMINMVVGELSQVIINILNNSKDIMIEKNIKDRWIKLSLTHSNNIAVITIEDSGGGIPEDILPKIFEPYFTTKHQSQGTGLGLHMSYEIVTKHLHGKLHAKNGKNGAKFFIELPLS